MKLTDIYSEAIKQSDALVMLYDSLLTKNSRSMRADLKKRFIAAKLVQWPQRAGLWRSKNDSLLIVGTDDSRLSHKSFGSEALSILLKSALVFALAAVDKILHEAISIHFAALAKSGEIDDLVHIELSKAYEVARSARVRRGKGGKIVPRPGHKLKEEVLKQIYSGSYLSLRYLQKICAACGKDKIFSKYSKRLNATQTAQELQKNWTRTYYRRNCIAHECDIVRKAKARNIHYHNIGVQEIKADIYFAKMFGAFLADELK